MSSELVEFVGITRNACPTTDLLTYIGSIKLYVRRVTKIFRLKKIFSANNMLDTFKIHFHTLLFQLLCYFPILSLILVTFFICFHSSLRMSVMEHLDFVV